MKEDVAFFTDTEPANFCDGVVGGSSFHNLPFDVMGNIVPDEFPDIGTECGPLVILIQCVHVRIVLVIPGLHGVVGGTSVCLPVAGVSPGDSSLVHQIVHLAANAWEDFTCVRLFLGFTGTFEGLGCCSIVVVVIVAI